MQIAHSADRALSGWWVASSMRTKRSITLTVVFMTVFSLTLSLAGPVMVARAAAVDLFFDDFERPSSDDVGNGWVETEDEGVSDDAALVSSGGEKYARLAGGGDVQAAITHVIPAGGDVDPRLTFRWRGDKQADAGSGDELWAILGEPDEVPFFTADLKDNDGCNESGSGVPCEWNTEELTLPDDDICLDGGLLTFQNTANSGAETVAIDDVRVSCEEEPEPESAIHAFKFYDMDGDGAYNEGAGDFPLNDWEICWENENGDEDCQGTGDEEDGWVWWMDLPPGEYDIWEETPTGWEATTPTFVTEQLNEGEEIEVFFGNRVPESGNIHARKFYDLDQSGTWDWGEGEMPIPGWQICIEPGDFDTRTGEDLWWALFDDWQDCQLTDEQGLVWWMGLPLGTYEVWEEGGDGDWEQTVPSWGSYEVWIDEEGTIWFWDEDDEGDWVKADILLFGNWQEDREPPVSEFDEDSRYDHEIIPTEIVSLELRGTSTDNVALTLEGGSVQLRAHQLAGEFFVDSFFDIFTELEFSGPPRIFGDGNSFFNVFHNISCDTIVEHNPIPLELGGNEDIPIELVSLSLQSVDPITAVQWNGQWSPSGPGVYCFEAFATDDAGNVEHTAWAGPILYAPAPVISEESILEQVIDAVSAVISWITDHLSTSRVIYDTVSHEDPLVNTPCSEPLDFLNCYGYAFSTPEEDTGDEMTTEHSVTIEGLTPGTTYYYRVVSHGSPEIVGPQGSFTPPLPPTPPGGGGGAGNPSIPPSPPPVVPGSLPLENNGQSPSPLLPPEGQVLGFSELPETGGVALSLGAIFALFLLYAGMTTGVTSTLRRRKN